VTSPDAPASTAGTETPRPPRSAALVLAGLHLRLGSLALARAELETLSAAAELDASGRVDLAEVRWRTGDLIGAGAVAREALAGGTEPVVALVVAAEAAAALGRPTEARRLAGRAMSLVGGPIDPVFAGMPRSGVWPADPSEPVPSPATLFPPDRAAAGAGASADPDASGRWVLPSVDPAIVAALAAAPDPEPGFWDIPAAVPGAVTEEVPAAHTGPTGLEPKLILDAGEAALAAGDLASAALHLGLAVRVAPSIAPVVLEAIGETPDAGLQMVRGDAYRAVGRETDARRAYEFAMTIASAPPPPRAASPRDDMDPDEDDGEPS
jgi:hypothetical protein